MSIFGQNSILRTEGLRELTHEQFRKVAVRLKCVMMYIPRLAVTNEVHTQLLEHIVANTLVQSYDRLATIVTVHL